MTETYETSIFVAETSTCDAGTNETSICIAETSTCDAENNANSFLCCQN